MSPLALKNLTHNAFRILGLTAGVSQAEIDAAARKLRIWDDPTMIPATENDASWLGPVPRSGQDIEGAVARLADPQTRIEERLLWFCQTPPASEQVVRQQSVTAPAMHDATLVHLYRALLTNAASENIKAWRILIQRFKLLADSDDYLQWLFEAEGAGDFEKRASLEEIATAQRQIPLRLSSAVAGSINDALESNDFVSASQVVQLVRAGGSDTAAKDPAEAMLDRMEDDLVARCGELCDKINTAWKTQQISKLRPACNHAIARYGSIVEPLIDQIVWTTEDIDRRNRAKMHGVKLLVHTSSAYEAIYNFAASERTLITASHLAARTPMEPMVDDLLEKVKHAARRQRAGVPVQHRQQTETERKFKVIEGVYNDARDSWLGAIPLRLVIGLIVTLCGIARFACSSSSSNHTPSQIPRYNSHNFDQPGQ